MVKRINSFAIFVTITFFSTMIALSSGNDAATIALSPAHHPVTIAWIGDDPKPLLSTPSNDPKSRRQGKTRNHCIGVLE